jgi:hypothetical protein
MKRTLDTMLAPMQQTLPGLGERCTLMIGNQQLGHLTFTVQVLHHDQFVAPSVSHRLHLQAYCSKNSPHQVERLYDEGEHPLILGAHAYMMTGVKMHKSNMELQVRHAGNIGTAVLPHDAKSPLLR